MPLGRVLADFITVSPKLSRRRLRNLPLGVDAPEIPNDLKIAILRVFCLGVFLILLANLFRTQILRGVYFFDLANGNRVREIRTPSPRGIIFDRNGEALVSNLPAFELRKCDGEGKCTSSIVSKDQAIELGASGLKRGETLSVASARSYLFSEELAHVLGYVSGATAKEVERGIFELGQEVGRGGVEEKYNQILSGKFGKEIVEVDAVGNRLRTLSTVSPAPGRNLNLTIDLNLSRAVFAELKGVKAAVVASDPRNGEILAIVSSPSFDPNVFTDIVSDTAERNKKIAQIFSDAAQPLFDRAISGTYPPGSTFKIVTATAGLESGKIKPETTIVDPGILIIGPYKFPNWLYLRNGGTQGTLNVMSAIKVSNDIFFYKVGEAVGVDGLADWALRYGLAEKTGVDLPGEAEGVFPTRGWREKFSRDWYLGDTYHLAIGQGDLLVTPLQVNQWTSVIANNGKLCTPHVLINTNNPINTNKYQCKDVGLHQKTIDLIKEGMIEACSPGGTAYPLFEFKVKSSKFKVGDDDQKIQIACKTGTAEFGDPNDHTHAWLTAFAPACAEATAGKPACEPTIAVTVIVEGGGEGSDVAAPIVKKILEEYFSGKN